MVFQAPVLFEWRSIEDNIKLPLEMMGYSAERRTTRTNAMLELEYASGRYFTLIYSGGGALQWERGYPALAEATTAYERLVSAVADGRVDPAQPVYREDLEE